MNEKEFVKDFSLITEDLMSIANLIFFSVENEDSALFQFVICSIYNQMKYSKEEDLFTDEVKKEDKSVDSIH